MTVGWSALLKNPILPWGSCRGIDLNVSRIARTSERKINHDELRHNHHFNCGARPKGSTESHARFSPEHLPAPQSMYHAAAYLSGPPHAAATLVSRKADKGRQPPPGRYNSQRLYLLQSPLSANNEWFSLPHHRRNTAQSVLIPPMLCRRPPASKKAKMTSPPHVAAT